MEKIEYLLIFIVDIINNMNTQIHDPIHDTITLTQLMKNIIDTHEFQRLRDLKQLGATYFVFPSATHTRFEHSIGVSHLAGELMTVLQKNQPRLCITDRAIELTRIAGLVHDIGHGPFSHLYDDHIRASGEDEHETRGCKLFKSMVEKYKLPISEQEVAHICLMIDPGKKLQKSWSYQIISNKMCQIDVDKLDYIQRDCYHLGLNTSETFSRIIQSVRVITTPNGNEVLGWPKKVGFNIFNLFATRYRLHKQVYNHHTIKAHEFIIVDILKQIKRSIGVAVWKLTDSAIMCPLHSQFSEFYKKIQTRNINKLVGEMVVKLPHDSYHPEDPNPRLILDHVIQLTKIGFAGGDKNPLNQVYYYTKDNPDQGFHISLQDSSFCIPSQHQELIVRMYSTNNTITKAQLSSWADCQEKWRKA